jgi:hypothetical protein
MPGFYFTAELDCFEDLSVKLTRSALDALAAPADSIRRMAKEAVHKTFPPEECVELYRQVRACIGG